MASNAKRMSSRHCAAKIIIKIGLTKHQSDFFHGTQDMVVGFLDLEQRGS